MQRTAENREQESYCVLSCYNFSVFKGARTVGKWGSFIPFHLSATSDAIPELLPQKPKTDLKRSALQNVNLHIFISIAIASREEETV